MDKLNEFARIQRDTGAHKVVMTALEDNILQCDLFFDCGGRRATVQAEFNLASDEAYAAECTWVRFELEAWLNWVAESQFN